MHFRKPLSCTPLHGRPTVAYQLVDALSYAETMTTQIAIRLAVSELAALDHEVAEGRASNRSDAVRRAIAYLQRAQRYRDEEAKLIELARKAEALYPDLDVASDAAHQVLD